MTMAKAKKKKKPEYKLIEKRNKRWAVIGKDGNYINGEEKVNILVKEGKIKVAKPKKKVEEPVEEAAPEEIEAEEAPAEEDQAEEGSQEEAQVEESTEEGTAEK
jgi:hypothetical protein